MSKSILKGLTAAHVRRAIKDLDDGIEHSFGKQRRYSVIYNGKLYAPKAVVGVAFRHFTGEILPPRAFSGGIQPGQANFVLEELGFHVVDSHDSGKDHSSKLVEATIKAKMEGDFEPTSLEDERERRLRQIVQRRGQPEFRNKLITAYDGRCAVTNCDAVSALEAAHITPYLGPESNHVTNGLLLRADIHTLFDLDLIGIDPESLRVMVAIQLRETCYEELDGHELNMPDEASLAPSKEALQKKWESLQE